MQATADADYFLMRPDAPSRARRRPPSAPRCSRAYRWQYIVSGVQDPRFNEVLGWMITPAQGERIAAALKPLFA